MSFDIFNKFWDASKSSERVVTRCLFPVALILPLGVGVLQWTGLKAGYYDAKTGVVLAAITVSLLFAGFVWMINRILRRLDLERRQVDEKAGELHERYRHVFTSSPMALGLSTPAEGRFIDVNSSFIHLFGYQRDDVIGHTSLELNLWESPEIRGVLMQIMAEKKQVHNYECRFLKKNKEVCDVQLTADLIEVKDEKFLIWIINDITVRKQNEEKIGDFIQLLNEAQDAICVRDMDDRIQYWNSGAERMFGCTAEEVLGQQIADRLYPDMSAFEASKKTTIEKGRWRGELRLKDQKGQPLIVNSRSTLAFAANGRPKSILMIYTDITEAKNYESQLLRSQRMESIGTLAGGIAHDLNNILTPILMSVPILRESVTDAEGQSTITMVEASVERAASIIKQLLIFARGLQAQQRVIESKYLLQEISRLVQATFSKSLKIEVHYSNDLWSVKGDATQLHQVLLNLSVNARDAMPEGGRLILRGENTWLEPSFTQTIPESHPGPYLLITVADTGIGIAPEHMEKIFDPFFTTKGIGKGTGLGLSVVLGIVKNHGGFIGVDSEPGRGSTFRIYLPASGGNVDLNSACRKTEAPMPRGNGELILIVDDEESIRNMALSLLEKNGYRVLTAADGTEAVSCYVQHKNEIGAVITDMMMPHMDGQAVIKALKHINPQVRIIVASGMTGERPEDHEIVNLPHLGKPFKTSQLLETLACILKTT